MTVLYFKDQSHVDVSQVLDPSTFDGSFITLENWDPETVGNQTIMLEEEVTSIFS